MRILFLILVSFHALIHLTGFVKAFGLADVKQLTQNISKPFGIVWLCAAILFAIAAIMFATKNNYWWAFGFMAVLISLVLIISSWHDAKFGTIVNIIILVASVIGYESWHFYSKYQNDVKTGLQQPAYFQNSAMTETEMEGLPEPVKKYIRYSGAIGKPKVNNFRIAFTGKIRKNEQNEWMPFTSVQYNFMSTPTRLFFMNATMKHMPIEGYHCYKNADAFMDIRLLSLFKVQYMAGTEMDTAETVTFFNDMCCMAPATLVDKRIKWLETDGNKVSASFTVNNITIHAWLYFNDGGALINFTSGDRYDADAGRKLLWATPLKDYRTINGYNLATSAETIYTYPDRDMVYGTFNLSEITYNVKTF